MLMSFGQAVANATAYAMDRNSKVFLYGEGINDSGGYFGSTAGLAQRFGTSRCFDVPNSEDALVGLGVGAAMCGYHPLFVSLRADFLMLAMNQIVNHAARWPTMTGHQIDVPLTIRALIGRGWGQAAQHSGALHSLFANIPGIDVVLPASPGEAAGLLLASLDSRNTTIMLEEKSLYDIEEEVDLPPLPIPLGRARLMRRGNDTSFIAISSMVSFAMDVAEQVAANGIEADVIDLRTIRPLDREAVIASVARTGSAVIYDIGWPAFGLAAEIARVLAESQALRGPFLTVARADAHTPASCFLESEYYPKADEVATRVVETLAHRRIPVQTSRRQ